MPGSNLRFLVVEDHEFQRRSLVQLLRTLGAKTVHAAEDGRSALQVLRDPDRPVDIVISDVDMPGMDGMEFIRNLGESGARVSLILASALDPPLLASIAGMARAYQVRLLGALGKPAAAVKLTPLLELHRAQQAGTVAPEALFTFDEIADAWTHHELEPWFAPRVHLETGAVVAMDTQPRWQHPHRGLLAPPDFLPSIAARGLRDDFAWLMLQKGVVQCRAWQRAGLDLQVAASLGFDSLADVQLSVRIRQLVQNEDLDPARLVLGVREQALEQATPRVLENLARLRMDGFGLAIDDFGSGAMAIEQIGQVAFTEVKVGAAFVAGVDRDEAARAGLAVALELAGQMKLRTVADGIANKGEWKLLRDWGCQLAQGPFVAPPLPAAEVAGWLARWTGSTIR